MGLLPSLDVAGAWGREPLGSSPPLSPLASLSHAYIKDLSMCVLVQPFGQQLSPSLAPEMFRY